MFINKKKEPVGSVLKLFKVITPQDLYQFNPKIIHDAVRLSLKVFFNNDENVFNLVALNYGSKNWKSLAVFLNKINDLQADLEVVDLAISHSGNSNKILYSNALLNRVKRDDFGLVEINICSELDNINESTVSSFVKEFSGLFPIDYGYVLPLKKGMDISSEKIIKKSIFGSSVSVTKEDILKRNRLLDIKNGFLPDLYPINILNQSQFDGLDSDKISKAEIVSVNNDLRLMVVSATQEKS